MGPKTEVLPLRSTVTLSSSTRFNLALAGHLSGHYLDGKRRPRKAHIGSSSVPRARRAFENPGELAPTRCSLLDSRRRGRAIAPSGKKHARASSAQDPQSKTA